MRNCNDNTANSQRTVGPFHPHVRTGGPTREVAHDIALRAAETDAISGALVTFGNPLGLALYDKDQAGVTRPARVSNGRSATGSPVTLGLAAQGSDGGLRPPQGESPQ